MRVPSEAPGRPSAVGSAVGKVPVLGPLERGGKVLHGDDPECPDRHTDIDHGAHDSTGQRYLYGRFRLL